MGSVGPPRDCESGAQGAALPARLSQLAWWCFQGCWSNQTPYHWAVHILVSANVNASAVRLPIPIRDERHERGRSTVSRWENVCDVTITRTIICISRQQQCIDLRAILPIDDG